MSFIQKTLIGLAVIASAGTWGYGRFGTEKTEEITVISVNDYASAEDQAKGEHDYSVTTDKGIFENTSGMLSVKSDKQAENLQSYFKVGGKYKVTSYDPIIGERNVTNVTVDDLNPSTSGGGGLSGQTKDVTVEFNGSTVVVQVPVEAAGNVVVKDIKGGSQVTTPTTPTTPATGSTTGTKDGSMPGVPTKEDLSVKKAPGL